MSLSFPKKTEKNPHPHTNRVLRLRLRNKHAESVPADSKLRFFTVFCPPLKITNTISTDVRNSTEAN